MDANWKKVFGVIWTGQFFSVLTSSLVNFAIIIWLSLKTGSAETLAWATIAGLLPQAIIGPFAGVFIDRWNRKLVMMLADTFIALCTLILVVLFWMNIAQMWHIFILLALRSIGSALHMPAMQASVPLLAPTDQLTRIAGINQMIVSVSQIAGPALGAMLIAIWDIEYVLLFDVAGAMIAVTSLFFVHIPNPEKRKAEKRHVFRELKEGVLAILQNKGLSYVFLFSILVTFFLMPISVLFPLMTLNHFGGTELQIGFIEAIWSVGALLGGAIMGIKVYRVNRVILINWMYLICGATFLLSGLLSSEGFVWFAILTVISGVSGAVYNSAFMGIVQTKVDIHVLGRVLSIFLTFSLIPSMLGLVGIGFFADGLGLTTSFILCGAAIMSVGLIAFATPMTIKLDRQE